MNTVDGVFHYPLQFVIGHRFHPIGQTGQSIDQLSFAPTRSSQGLISGLQGGHFRFDSSSLLLQLSQHGGQFCHQIVVAQQQFPGTGFDFLIQFSQLDAQSLNSGSELSRFGQ
ncbi:MAG: hypothetical protein R3C12_21395 [Planctomycetaceae bacterium]